jgi:hypothetical protein
MASFKELRAKRKPYQDAPAMLVLKRVGIRNYPNGQSVALYHNAALDVNISVPFNKSSLDPDGRLGTPVQIGSLLPVAAVSEGVIGSLKNIAQSQQPGNIKFNNGTSEEVHPSIAQQIIDVHSKLDNSNKDKFERLVNVGPAGLQKVTHWLKKLESSK